MAAGHGSSLHLGGRVGPLNLVRCCCRVSANQWRMNSPLHLDDRELDLFEVDRHDAICTLLI